MGRRLPNPYLIKRRQNYSIADASKLLEVHPNTVRNWIRSGLSVVDALRPPLIIGEHLAFFLELLRKQNKVRCAPGEIYCMRCRRPRIPLQNSVALHIISTNYANLAGQCSSCGARMNQRVRLSGLRLETGQSST